MKKIILFILCTMVFAQSKAIDDTLTIRAKPSNSRFRYLNNSPVGAGSNSAGEGMLIARWTAGGIPYTWRSFLKFDLSSIPAGSVIDTAYLSVYANVTSPSGNPGYPTWGTDNAVGIYRLTAAWDTTTINWATQPAYTTVNGDTLAQSTTWMQNYTNVEVTALVRDAYTLGNHGFIFKHLQETAHLNSMIFYSPYRFAVDTTQVPKLVIKYTSPASVVEQAGSKLVFDMYPNPATGTVHFNMVNGPADAVTITIMDRTGRIMGTQQLAGHTTRHDIDLEGYAKGIYFVRLQNTSGNITTKKLVVH